MTTSSSPRGMMPVSSSRRDVVEQKKKKRIWHIINVPKAILTLAFAFVISSYNIINVYRLLFSQSEQVGQNQQLMVDSDAPKIKPKTKEEVAGRENGTSRRASLTPNDTLNHHHKSKHNLSPFAWKHNTSLGIPDNEFGTFYISFGICCSREAQQSGGGRPREIQKHNHSNKRYDVALALAASLWTRHYQSDRRVSIFVAAGYIKGNEESEANLVNLQTWLGKVENMFRGKAATNKKIIIWPYDVSSFDNPFFACIRTAQLGRFYAHESGFVKENDFISSSDTDLFPINHHAMMPILDGQHHRNPKGDFYRVFIRDWAWTVGTGRTIPVGIGLGQTAYDWERSLRLVLGTSMLKDAIDKADSLTSNTWGFDQTLSTNAIKQGQLCYYPADGAELPITNGADDKYTCFKGIDNVRKECLNAYDREKRCNFAHFTPDVKEEVMRHAYDEIVTDLYPTEQSMMAAEKILGKQRQTVTAGPTYLVDPILFDESVGWNGTTHDGGMTFCKNRLGPESSVCSWELYCPKGVLAQQILQRGLREEVVWSPISMKGQSQAVWVSIGSANACIQSGSPLEASKSKAKYIMCCRKGTSPPKELQQYEEVGDVQPLRETMRPGVQFNGCAKSFSKRACGIHGTRPPSLPYVSGDFFRCISDVSFDETNQYEATKEDSECLNSLHKQSAFTGPFLVFVKTDIIHTKLEKIKEIDSIIPGKYILITHNSDFSANSEAIEVIENLPQLVHWYGQNIEASRLRTTIPIGLENLWRGRAYPGVYGKVAALNVTKTQKYLASANFRPRHSERRALLERLKSLEWVDTTGWGYHSTDPTVSKHEAWLRKQAEYKFVISPPGNGIDCHRTFEMILLGAIPVMRSTIIDSVFADLQEEGAVLIVRDWTDLNKTLLEDHWQKFGQNLIKRSDSWLTSGKNNNMLSQYWVNRFISHSTPVHSAVGQSESAEKGVSISKSARKPNIHFRTYGNELYQGAKKRIISEAIETGWFTTARALGPEDLNETFRNKFKEILALPRGGGYWIWKFDVFDQAMSMMDEGDFLVYLDSGSHINKGGEKRFYEYIDMVAQSQYDIIGFQMPFPEYKWTTPRLFKAFNITKEGDVSITLDGQIEANTIVFQKGPHYRKLIEMCLSVIHADPWLITDIYNNEAKEQEPSFRENRHDQSIMSVSRKKMGYVWVNGIESKKELADMPFHLLRKRD